MGEESKTVSSIMGKELISASGNGHSDIVFWWVVEIITAALCIVLGIFFANKFGYVQVDTLFYTSTVKNEFYYNLWIVLGITSSVLCLVMAALCHTRISRTAISVCENGIEGFSVVPKFPLSFMIYGAISSLQLAEFRLKYDQVSSVDVVNENCIVIHTVNTDHKIYAMNSREVRDVISKQKEIVNLISGQKS